MDLIKVLGLLLMVAGIVVSVMEDVCVGGLIFLVGVILYLFKPGNLPRPPFRWFRTMVVVSDTEAG